MVCQSLLECRGFRERRGRAHFKTYITPISPSRSDRFSAWIANDPPLLATDAKRGAIGLLSLRTLGIKLSKDGIIDIGLQWRLHGLERKPLTIAPQLDP